MSHLIGDDDGCGCLSVVLRRAPSLDVTALASYQQAHSQIRPGGVERWNLDRSDGRDDEEEIQPHLGGNHANVARKLIIEAA